MRITGTYISYYHYCQRRLWLFAHDINMEHTSDFVAEGKLIDEKSYPQRAEKFTQIAIEGIKVDFFNLTTKVVHETKRSSSNIECDIAQLKYYLFVLERNNIEVSHGILEYPKLRKTEEIWLTEADRLDIPRWEMAARAIIAADTCPPTIVDKLCKKCAYYEFCYAE